MVITLNEAANIRRCLGSLAFCDEMLVVDSGSEDGTTDIARSMGARVLHQDWLGFGPQKHHAVKYASNDWVLCLDADEWVSDALSRSIRLLMESRPDHHAYCFPRRNILLGRALRFGGGYPDAKLRLFDRRHAQWNKASVHEEVETTRQVGFIEADLMHETAPSLPDAMAKWARYTSMQAEAMHASGARSGWVRIVFSPLVRFMKMYILKQGFRDGLAGLALAVFSSFFCFLKYLELWRMQDLSGKKE